ncbi:MAG: hypothetical protein MUC96_26400 [Myxococcaceae bacterium]|jgi:hypothetical protein|nr:hypothetical protein [Myxococcaceae bacterium]
MACDTFEVTEAEFKERFLALLKAQRETTLWYVKPDYVPVTDDEQRLVLVAIQWRGDLATFKEAGVLLTWLSCRSTETTAAPR